MSELDKNEEFVRLNVNMTRNLYKKIKYKALEMDMTITDLIISICNKDIDDLLDDTDSKNFVLALTKVCDLGYDVIISKKKSDNKKNKGKK